MKKLVLLLFVLGSALNAQTSGSIDPSFSGIASGFNGTVNSIAIQGDGKILVGGNFTTYNGVDCPDRLVRLTSTGALDGTFTGSTSGFDNSVTSIALQSDGKILACGNFTTYNGVDCPDRFVRLTSTGAIDGTFTGLTSGFDNVAFSLAVQSDDKILVGGRFTTYNGVDCPDRFVRLTSTGALDGTFTGLTLGFNDFVSSIIVQSDGKILVGGYFLSYNGVDCPDRFVRLTSTGTLDGSFTGLTSGFNNAVTSIAVQNDGKILVGGNFLAYNGVDCPDRLVRLTSTGALDVSFAGSTSGINSSVYSIVVQCDGKILIGGYFTTFNGADCPDYFLRLTSTGALDNSFSGLVSGVNGYVYSIAIQSDGKILVGGDYTTYNGINCPDRLIRLLVPLQLSTMPISSITETGAISGGNISETGTPITSRGVCWNTTGLPTKDLTTKTEETDTFFTGLYSANISGLSPNTVYHVRAYATNSVGTAYGNEITFTTIPTLGQWGLIAFGSLIALIGGAVVWRRFA